MMFSGGWQACCAWIRPQIAGIVAANVDLSKIRYMAQLFASYTAVGMMVLPRVLSKNGEAVG